MEKSDAVTKEESIAGPHKNLPLGCQGGGQTNRPGRTVFSWIQTAGVRHESRPRVGRIQSERMNRKITPFQFGSLFIEPGLTIPTCRKFQSVTQRLGPEQLHF